MGHYPTCGGGKLLDSYARLLDDCSSTGNLTLAAGDVTVPFKLTAHSAGRT